MSLEQLGESRLELPFREAFHISLEQIRRRRKRSIITITSVSLGISFMSYFLMTNLIFEAYQEHTGMIVEAYQFWLVIVSILVCVVGLINATLIAVYERYQEIGTMKSLGALDRHVMVLFLIESTIYGSLGGILGFIGGAFIAATSAFFQINVSALWSVPFIDIIFYFCLSVSLAVVLSVMATIYPAYKAARLKPVEALAYDI